MAQVARPITRAKSRSAGAGAFLARAAAALIAAALLVPAGAAAQAPDPGPYRANDFAGGGLLNIVPPGQNGLTTAADAAEFAATGQRPPHQYDQNNMYANLVYAAPGLEQAQVDDYFKDASFGTRPADVEREYGPQCAVVTPPSPISEHCGDVTIVRDGFGVPHVYGANRAALMFGLGYVTGEDRLFLADVLRHAGRAQLSSFVGGSQGNRETDHDVWSNAPYRSDAEMRLQYERADELYGAEGEQIQADVQDYVDGVNQWIAEARLDPANKMDALYAATNHPEGPQPWKVEDVIATGSLVAGIFGKGGGGEVAAATSLQSAKQVLGRRQGKLVWKDFRSADDPEAPRTVHEGEFPYRTPPQGERRGLAMPDPGSVKPVDVVETSTAEGSASASDSAETGTLGDLLRPLRGLEGGSNALLVSKRESSGGHPTAVFGPQTGYFAPQLLMEQDAHAPAGPEGPAIHARGVSFVGTNLYVQLGRGVDYAWSATSAGQDIIDTFALKLCEPDGSQPRRSSKHYIWNGNCVPMDVLRRSNSWEPNAADPTKPGSETLRTFRTKLGLVTHRATIDGDPVVYTSLRATYMHEVDAAGSFADWNSPNVVHNAEDWMESGYKNDLTFNWFYIDDQEIAYFNSGANPVRAEGTHPNFPVEGKRRFLWEDFDPNLVTFQREPIESHPQVRDQRFLTSWNNKQALGYRNDDIRGFTSLYRVDPLDDRIKEGIGGDKRMSLVELIEAMEDAGTVDLRGDKVVGPALRVISGGDGIRGPRVRAAAEKMRAWADDGAHRRDFDDDGNYDHANAVRIMDAWWPLWVKRQFKPTLGEELHDAFIGEGGAIHDAPGPVGSAFQNVVYGFVDKDLRTLLGRDVEAPYSRVYCGKGSQDRCARMLRRTLLKAADTNFQELYGSEGCTLNNGTEASAQMCHDAVDATDVTVAAVDEFHWINRPTFQQVVQIEGHR